MKRKNNVRGECFLTEKIYYIYNTIFIITIALLSIANIKFDFFLFGAYFLMSLVYIKNIEPFLALITLTSTISYFFLGADEAVFSLYSIFIAIELIRNFIIKDKGLFILKRDMFWLCCIILLAFFSFFYSPFNYGMGLLELSYIVVFSIFLLTVSRIDMQKFINHLEYLSYLMVLVYGAILVLNGTSVEGRYTLANGINTNTFGMSCVQLGIIIYLSNLVKTKQKKIKLANIFLFIDLCLVLLSGSRTSLFSLITSILIIKFILAYIQGRMKYESIKYIIAFLFSTMLIVILIDNFGVDFSRYNYIELLQAGGTNRFTIYTSVLPYIIDNGFWKIGYGPGHECSRIVVTNLLGRSYTHTHNLYLEAFAELGICGLVVFMILLKKAIKNAYTNGKKSGIYFLPLGMLIGLMFNGMAEAYFCDIFLWILIAINLKSSFHNKDRR